MKYSILGFNQEKIVVYNKDGLKCDLIDLLLLNYIIYAQANPKMKHRVDDEMKPCVWLQHEHILEDLPILNITEGTLKNRLTKLRKMELITSKTIANENSQGSRTYYRTTSFLYDMLFETTSLKNDVIEEPRHSKMTSNTQVNNNKEVNKVVSKDTTTEFEFGKSKPKKESLYTKCVTLIDSYDFSNKGNIRKLLIEYLQFRLSVRDKSLYVNMWKGMLNKLNEMCGKNVAMCEAIIKQSIERGYLSFYPISSGSNNASLSSKPWERGVRSDRYTEEELEELAELDRQREAQGLRTRF